MPPRRCHTMSKCHGSERHNRRCIALYGDDVGSLALIVLAVLVGLAASACEMGPAPQRFDGPDGPDVGSVQQAVTTENRLALNRLALNRLALNSLALDSLALSEVDDGSFELTSELEETQEGREVLKYIAQCALSEGDSLVVEHDGESEELPGLLGLLPGWVEREMSAGEQRLLSACLLAHVNAFGVSVAISVRAGSLSYGQDELREYSVYEGTFFGQVFDGELERIYSCQGHAADNAREASEARHMRVCTDLDDDCGVISLGRCRDVCDRFEEDVGWTECWADGQRYDETVSVHLFADDPYGQNEFCDSVEECQMLVGWGSSAVLKCRSGEECDATCWTGARCIVDMEDGEEVDVEIRFGSEGETRCADVDDCDLECADGAECEFECYDVNQCDVECKRGSSCDIYCRGETDGCDDVRCTDSSSCLLDCRNGGDCEFAVCHGYEQTCAGGVVVCNRPCPDDL